MAVPVMHWIGQRIVKFLASPLSVVPHGGQRT
jgi:hypothetical protein